MTVYWWNGTGNWSDATHWSNTDGGAGGADPHGSEPGIDDDVVFDSLSNATDYTVTVDSAAGTRACQNLTMGAPLTGKVTWAGTITLNVYGNFSLSGGTAGITKTSGGILNFKATGNVNIDWNGVANQGSSINFNGVGGTFNLINNLSFITNVGTFTLTNGTFNAGTYLVTFSVQYTINGAFTFYDLKFDGGKTISLATNITVSNLLTINGASTTSRQFIKSNTLGTPRTITAHAISVTNADFQDIVGAGDATWDMSTVAGGSGNCGGNTMQALGDSAFTVADGWYWYADTGSFTSTTQWWTTTGGTGTRIDSDARNAKCVLPQDTCYFDNLSFSAGSKIVTQNIPRIGSVVWTGATNTPTWTTSTACSVLGSITLISGMILTASTETYTFAGRGSYTLDSGGLTWEKPITLNAPSGTLTLKNNFTMGITRTFTITTGTLTCVDGANNWVISAGLVSVASSSSAILTLGSATHLITGTAGTVWSFGANGVLTANTSTIKLTGALTGGIAFNGGGKTTYNNLWNNTTNAQILTVTDTNTFADFKIDAGRTVKFTNSTTTTVTTFTALGTSGSHIVISNTSSTTHATLAKAGGGVISGCDYIDIQEMTGSPANTWFIGANSTDTGNTCTNIYLSNAPTFSGFQLNIGDVWKTCTSGQLNIGDTWKTITKAQINIGDVWKSIF